MDYYYDEDGALRQRLADIDDRHEDLKDEILMYFGSIDSFLELYDISLIFHENGLEGRVLNYAEIKSAVDNRIVSDVSLLPTYEDIKGQKLCIAGVREKARSKRVNVSLSYLKEMHGRLVGDPELAGEYRKDIPIHRTYFHEIALPTKIQSKLLKVLEYMKTRPDRDLHPIEFAANVHHRFMRVFPYSEYSGFLGRLMGNFVLMRHDYLPAIIHATDRQRYYEALRGTEEDFRVFTIEAVEAVLDNTGHLLDEYRPERAKLLRQAGS